jgi:hypothetical protein
MFNGGKSDVVTVLVKSQARIVIPTRDAYKVCVSMKMIPQGCF